MKNPDKKPSIADQILERLQHFAETLERGEPIAQTFRCRRIELRGGSHQITPLQTASSVSACWSVS
jgi:hypothetical protein